MVGRQRERRRVLSSDRILYRAWVHTRDVHRTSLSSVICWCKKIGLLFKCKSLLS